MLSLMSRLTVFGMAALAVLWLLGVSAKWSVILGLLGFGVIAGFHGWVMAVEFPWMHRSNQSDPAPKATWREVGRAWWAEVKLGYRVFGWEQAFRANDEADHVLPSHRGQRGVVLVHGFVCNRGLWNAWMPRLRAKGVPFVAVTMEPVFGSIEEYAPAIDAAVDRLHAATGLTPVIVAHSMGGLAARAWLRGRRASVVGTALPVHSIITIGTPHHGTKLSMLSVPNVEQMRRHSVWLKDLAVGEPMTVRKLFTCFYSNCDNVVFPASTATLPGADNRHVSGYAHVQLLDCPTIFEAVVARVIEPAAQTSPGPSSVEVASTSASTMAGADAEQPTDHLIEQPPAPEDVALGDPPEGPRPAHRDVHPVGEPLPPRANAA
jgi:triacylglycerol lipase